MNPEVQQIAEIDVGRRAQRHVEEGAGQHAEEGGDEIGGERHPRDPEGVVEQVEGNDRGEPEQEDDLEPVLGDRFVDGGEPRVGRG